MNGIRVVWSGQRSGQGRLYALLLLQLAATAAASAHEAGTPSPESQGAGTPEPAARTTGQGSEPLEAIEVKTEKRQPPRRKKRASPSVGRSVGDTATGETGGATGSPAIGGGASVGAEAPVQSSSERAVSGAQVNERAFSRPAEALEVVPGLIITQHSGEGKANQYFLRGFNLDHGTDLALTLDGMPLNMPTHGHGQGYADANFIIPELIASAQYRKGPYFAEEGDFSSAGAVHIDYLDHPDKNLALATYGGFGYARALGAASEKLGEGNILAAAEASVYDGPWQVSDGIRKYNGLLRYSQGTLEDGFAVTAMAYGNRWTSTDQIPERAVATGYIDLYGSMDPTDGGDMQRYSLSGHWHHSDQDSSSKVEAYAIHSSLELFNNFTYFLDHPDIGDQFRQFDQRTIIGGQASHTLKGDIAGLRVENEFGVQTRYDDIRVGLQNTYRRQIWNTVRDDSVQEGNVGLFFEDRIKWSDWFRTTAGLRQDFFAAHVNSDTPANSGDASDSMLSPKLGAVFGPFWKTELFLNAGTGFHSNDARGATITVDPNDKTTRLDRVPLMVQSQGAEAGVRTKLIDGLDSSVSVFVLDFDSENLFVGDAGTTEASRPSRRMGVEWANHYKPQTWLSFDADLAITQARFTNYDPVGDHIPGAPTIVGSAGITIGEAKGWYAGAGLRYFAPRPLIEDNSIRSPVTLLLNARLGYHFDDGWTVQLDGFNLTNSSTSQIDYAYVSRLPGEPAGGVLDRVFHPVEPLAIRLTLAKQF